MKSNAVAAGAGAFVLGCIASSALARGWLEPPNSNPRAEPAPGPTLLATPFVNYGTRAQVRIIRPDGVYELRNGRYEFSPSGFDDAETETTDD